MAELSLWGTIENLISNQWQRLAYAGTWYTGEQKVAIAQVVRESQAGVALSSNALPDVVTAAARKIAVDAHLIDQAWVEECYSRGLEPLHLVELTALVAQLSTFDTYKRGIGEQPIRLPFPQSGEPSQEEVKGTRMVRGWYPTRGVAGAPNCFSAVKLEHEALHKIHSLLYLSMEEMANLEIVKTLHRSQIELLAARTSLYNDCFY